MIILNQISKPLKSAAISVIPHSADQLLSRIFLVPKANGENRFVPNLSKLNTQIAKVHFKIETLDKVKEILMPNDFMTLIDLRNAFFTIPIHKSSKKYLCFEFEQLRYTFNVLYHLHGLTSSPRIFTKMLKPAIVYLQSLGYK